MAETIGMASGLVSLITFAFSASVSLHQMIQTFKNSSRQLQDLNDEVTSLVGVLDPLSKQIHDEDDDLKGLSLPMLHCGRACDGFEKLLVQCSTHSNGQRRSIRDWAKMMYMGHDIDGFRNMLAAYKGTISIALGGANLRKAVVTADVLTRYEQLIESTEARLQSHYEHIDRQLKLARPVTISEAGVQSRHAQIMEEMNSTRQCLGICTNVSARLEELRTPLITQSQVQYDVGTTTWPSATIAKSSEGFTVDLLNSLHNRTSNGLIELRRKLKVLEGQSHSLDGATGASKEDFEKSRMRKEREDVVQLLEICSAASEQAKEARTNIFEDIGAGDDANQIIVSTVGDLVSARRITAGARSIQMLGQVADETVLQVSRSGRSEFEQRSNNK